MLIPLQWINLLSELALYAFQLTKGFLALSQNLRKVDFFTNTADMEGMESL